jgi:hypothetical protein
MCSIMDIMDPELFGFCGGVVESLCECLCTMCCCCIYHTFVLRIQYEKYMDPTGVMRRIITIDRLCKFQKVLYFSYYSTWLNFVAYFARKVGYGNWSAVDSAEQVWCIIYAMLINIVAVKNDEKTKTGYLLASV